MKIKSWTGNDKYVEARNGMTYMYQNPKHKDFDILTIDGIIDIDGDVCLVSDLVAYNIEYCTMLHAPFVGGDCIQVRTLSGDWVSDIYDETRHCGCFIRHANPDLRDSPEYAP